MSHAYRGSDERASALDGEIASLTGRLTPIFWERVAAGWRIDADYDPAASDDPIGARHARIEVLRAAIARIEAAKGRPMGSLPARPDDVVATGAWDPLMSAFVHDVGALVPDARWMERGDGRHGTRFTFEDTSIEVTSLRQRIGKAWHYQIALRAAVPLGARLTLRPEGIAQDLLEMLGLRSEIELSDERFDPVFVVGGDEESARALLSVPVRLSLLDLTAANQVIVDVEGGVARIATMLPVSREALRQALRALAAMSRAPAPHRLLILE